MSIENLKQKLPPYAKDLKINLANLLLINNLTEQQLWGTLVACALASRNQQVITEITSEAQQHLEEIALQAAQVANALMAMNNIYYRFTHLIHDEIYQKLPANLRMTFIGNPGVEKVDFEFWCLAVSAINGCGLCMDAHEKVLRTHGMPPEAIQNAVRIAAVIKGVSAALT